MGGQRPGVTRASSAEAGAPINYVYDGLNSVEEQNGSGLVTGDMLGSGLDDWMTRADSAGTNATLHDGTNSTVGLLNSAGTLSSAAG